MSDHHVTRSQGSRRYWEQQQFDRRNIAGGSLGDFLNSNSTRVDIDTRIAANTAAQSLNVVNMNSNNFATAAGTSNAHSLISSPTRPSSNSNQVLRRSQRSRSAARKELVPQAAEIDVEEIDCKPKAKGLPKNDLDDAETDKSCCICLEIPTPETEARTDKCEHVFCFTCIEKWSERENTCPLCKTRFGRIERVHKQAKKRKKGESKQRVKNTKKVKNRNQRSEVNFGTAQIQNILLRLNRARSGAIQDDVERYFVAGGALGHARTEGAPRFNFPPGHRGFFPPSLSMQLEFGHDPFDVFIDGDRAMSAEPRFVTFPLNYGNNPEPAAAVPRSYATNTNVVNAGSTMDVPLEIADSDDDDAVEVVNVRRSSRRRR